MSETFLDSTIPLNDEILYIKGYEQIFNDKSRSSSNTKRGGVCLYYKEYLPLIRKVNICKLNECIVTEITVNNERCFLPCLYRSPNQNQEQFESFCENLIDVLSGINNQQQTCSILVGDFSAKLSKWWPSDKDIKAGQDIDTLQKLWVTFKWLVNRHILWMTSRHVLTSFLPQITNSSVMLESSKLFIINAIIILYMDHLISTYLFLHFTIGKFGITKIQMWYVYRMQFHQWIRMSSLVTKRQMKKLKVSTISHYIYFEILFLIRLSNSTISTPTGWILRLFCP